MQRSKGYWVMFAAFWLFAAVKLAMLITVIVCLINYLTGATAAEDVYVLTIKALLVDFVSMLIMWGLNKGLHFYKKVTTLLSLLSPVLLLAVLVLSVVVVGMDPASSEAAAVNTICWGLMVGYLVLPDAFIARDLIGLRHGLPGQNDDAPKTLSQRIRGAKR